MPIGDVRDAHEPHAHVVAIEEPPGGNVVVPFVPMHPYKIGPLNGFQPVIPNHFDSVRLGENVRIGRKPAQITGGIPELRHKNGRVKVLEQRIVRQIVAVEAEDVATLLGGL